MSSSNSQSADATPLALLVEDHEPTREMYATWLEFCGFRVIESNTVDDAMEKTLRLRPHVITTDIGLGGDRDGCNLCERLKADERTRDIPIIAITGWAVGSYIERARKAGCDLVLIKPCLPDDLLREILKLLQRSKARTH